MNARYAMLWRITLQTGRIAVAYRMMETECRGAGADVAEILFIRLRLTRPQKHQP